MDGGGRLDQPLMRSGLSGGDEVGAPVDEPSLAHAGSHRRGHAHLRQWLSGYRRRSLRWAAKFVRFPPPRGVGVIGFVLLLLATVAYGVVAGEHVGTIVAWARDARDAVANSLGFRIAAISLSGEKEVSREQILMAAGVNGGASLLFLDADVARRRLMANPWIADAAVLKLYPDRLQITIRERHAFALWQKSGRLSVIAEDGTVLEPFVERRYLKLPLVVGRGAARRAEDFLTIVDRYPDIRSKLRASILVAQRRWNLLLRNDIEVLLPETDVGPTLDRLVALDRTKKLLSRDITIVDLRLPDRVSVRLSDAAAQAREAVLKADKKKKKRGDA
jgi:cell division protein FtsQ